MGVEEMTSGGVIELTTIVTLDSLNSGAELSSYIRKKRESVENVSDLRRKGKVHEK
jgi:hypothetical protein